MRIVFLLDERFPYGMAASNRALLYARGLTEQGNDFIMLIPRATERHNNVLNSAVIGTYNGIKFMYAYETVIRKSFIGRRYQNFRSLLNSFAFLLRFRPDVILAGAKTFKFIFLVKVCSVLTGARLVREKSEVPFYREEKLSRISLLRTRAEFSLFHGIIVISKALGDFFHKDLKLNVRIFEVPIIIDSKEKGINGSAKVLPNLVYTGSLLDHKDGILTIIKAFALIRKKHDLNLVMSGNLDGSVDKAAILALIDHLDLKDKVRLTGYISREELSRLTSTATALLLAKPDNRQNRYNMATKIGEYLLSGRPAVISSIDPVCGYLKHRENACITKPAEEEIAAEVDFLLNNPSIADRIGSAGQECVARIFDYRAHIPGMISFFENLKHR